MQYRCPIINHSWSNNMCHPQLMHNVNSNKIFFLKKILPISVHSWARGTHVISILYIAIFISIIRSNYAIIHLTVVISWNQQEKLLLTSSHRRQCLSEVHVCLKYMFVWSTCLSEVHVCLKYMFVWSTCLSEVHVCLKYMFVWSTMSEVHCYVKFPNTAVSNGNAWCSQEMYSLMECLQWNVLFGTLSVPKWEQHAFPIKLSVFPMEQSSEFWDAPLTLTPLALLLNNKNPSKSSNCLCCLFWNGWSESV